MDSTPACAAFTRALTPSRRERSLTTMLIASTPMLGYGRRKHATLSPQLQPHRYVL